MEVLALALAFLLVALNAFFVATEFAIVKVRPTRIEELLRKQRPGATTARKLISNIDAYLSATQLGITLASLGLGWIGEPAFARLLQPALNAVAVIDPAWAHRISLASAFIVITLMHVVAGELAPKSLAILRSETVALAVAYPMRLFYLALFPVIWLLTVLSNLLVRSTGVEAPAGEHHSEEEIRIIVSQARSAGLLSASRSELLRRAMSLHAKTAKHLMVPRNEVVLLDINLSLEDNLARAMDSGHTRFPLCDRELDDVVGVVDIREVLFRTREGVEIDLRRVAAPATYLPELMSGERLLAEFRSRHLTMAVVVDEYGGASGIVTPADVIAAVMGEFEDEEAELVRLPGGAYDVEGTATIEEVEEALRISLHPNDMRTVAGFLMERLGRMPRVGDRIFESGHVFTVMAVSGPRIQRVRIQRQTGAERGKGSTPDSHDPPATTPPQRA